MLQSKAKSDGKPRPSTPREYPTKHPDREIYDKDGNRIGVIEGEPIIYGPGGMS